MRVSFVYGSLKQGFGNHRLLEHSTFLGETSIRGNFRMISLGGFPGVLEGEGYEESLVSVEAYSINDRTLEELDMLESEGDFYHRRPFKAENGLEGEMYILDDHFSGSETTSPRVDIWNNDKGDKVYGWTE